MRTPSTVFLRFQIPPQVLPIALARASLRVRVRAPSRKLDLLGFRGRLPVLLATRNSSVGRFDFEVTADDVLKLDDRGGLLLGIGIDRESATVGRGTLSPAGSPWKIEAVELEVAGTTLDPHESSETIDE